MRGKQFLIGIIAVLALPLMLLNMLGDVIAAIWLLCLWKWQALLLGFCGLFSHFFLGLAIMPSVLLAAPVVTLIEKGKARLAIILGLPAMVYIHGLVFSWCMVIIYLCLQMADAQSIIPMMLLAYGVATGPWAYMALQERQAGSGEEAATATFFAQLGCAVAILLILLFNVEFATAAIVVGLVIAAGATMQYVLAAMAQIAEEKSIGTNASQH
jgi:hypothetical protein